MAALEATAKEVSSRIHIAIIIKEVIRDRMVVASNQAAT